MARKRLSLAALSARIYDKDIKIKTQRKTTRKAEDK
jgi:hypothetical protein